MKKIYLALSLLVFAFAANAQTIPNGGMETWRVNSAGSTNPKIVRCPINWYGADSLIIGIGQSFGTLLGISDTVWQQQIYKDSGINAHGGTYSAKLVTKNQDTLGIFPGILSNAETHVAISLTGIGGFSQTGGLGTTLRTKTVSAWVKYSPASPVDSAAINIEAHGNVNGVADSLIGFGFLKVGASSSFVQVTVNMTYPDTTLIMDTLRISFASSADTAAVGSTLWVDDVTAVGVAQPISVNNVYANANISVYPNPASDVLYIDNKATAALTANLYAVNGAVVATKAISGNGKMDISTLPAGLYFYSLTDSGTILKRGKITVVR